MQIAYIVHNLNDPAVSRRVRMLTAGGASVLVAGFCRGGLALQHIDGSRIVCNLGETFDGRPGHRAASVVRAVMRTPRLRKAFEGTEVVLARNLEALAVGFALHCQLADSRLVYEVLDIHKLLLGQSAISVAIRSIERLLMRAVSLLIVSSPAFLSEFYELRQCWPGPSLLVENKVFDRNLPSRRPESQSAKSPPWTIGWFGVIRCSKSLEILKQLVQRSHGRLKVQIRGQVARQEFDDFDGEVLKTEGMEYLGPYHYSEIDKLYKQTHFTWAIDYFEEGLNSSWLLPNRLYEGGLMGGPSIALEAVQTGRWLAQEGVGVLVETPLLDLTRFFSALNADTYSQLWNKLQNLNIERVRATTSDCVRLVDSLRNR